MTDETTAAPGDEAGQPGSPAPNGAGEPPPATRPWRPWLGPAIASGVLALTILLLSLPSVLIFPRSVRLDDAAVKETGDALEERVTKLKALLGAGVCRLNDGGLRLLDPKPDGPTQNDLDNMFPPEIDPRRKDPDTNRGGPAPSQSAFLDKVDQGVSLVLAGRSSGTSFFISPELAVTNAHVVDPLKVGDKVVIVNKAAGKSMEAVIQATTGVGRTGEPDFALLRLEGGAKAPGLIPVAATPQRSQTVIAAGYPGIILESDPNFQAVINGDVSHVPDASTWPGMVAHVQHPLNVDVIVHSASTFPGNSGGPLLDRCARATGVNTFILDSGGRGLNYALGSGDLAGWLTEQGVEVQADPTPCAPTAGAPDEQQ